MFPASAYRHPFNKRDKYLFNPDDYIVIRIIKRGGFGVISLVKNKETGEEFVAKTNFIQHTKTHKLYVSREVSIFIQVQHPTIIQFRGFSYTDFNHNNNVTILMDYMENGSLADLIEKEERSLCPIEYDNTKRQKILIGIARGMMILHKLHIINRDLKPENVLIDSDFIPHITDFGLSKFFDPNNSSKQSFADGGTAEYMAPEVITSDQYNIKADVYSFGILMYEVITGRRAYENLRTGRDKISIFQLKEKIVNGYRPEIEEGMMKKGLKIMIEKCWSAKPSERPTFTELYRKLSLSDDDFLLDIENNTVPSVIECDDDDGNDEDIGLNTKFCLDQPINYEEILDYVEHIDVEARTLDEIESNMNRQEIVQLKNEVDELKRTTQSQQETITLLRTELERVTADNQTFREQIDQLNIQLSERQPTQESYQYGNDSDMPKIGIISHLNGAVTLSAGGVIKDSYPISNITEDNNRFFYNYYNYEPSSVNDSFIKFDFGEKTKVDLCSYYIRSNDGDPGSDCHPKTWEIKGSNDNETWTRIDRRENDEHLNGRLKAHNFVCCECEHGQPENRFRYIIYRQEDSWMNDKPYNVCITFFELYGEVYKSE